MNATVGLWSTKINAVDCARTRLHPCMTFYCFSNVALWGPVNTITHAEAFTAVVIVTTERTIRPVMPTMVEHQWFCYLLVVDGTRVHIELQV